MQHLKVQYLFAGYERTLDNTRISADNILNLHLTEILKTQYITANNLIKQKIDSATRLNWCKYKRYQETPDCGRSNIKGDTRTKTRSKPSLRSRMTKV